MLSVSIRQIEYVVAVAEHGGVTSAADALHVSQPALSVAISRLEQHLGKPLFIRRKGCAVVPTSFGRIFLEESNQILQSLTRLVEPGVSKAGQYQPIVAGCFEDLAPMVVGRLHAFVKQRYPGIVLTTKIGDFEWLYDEMTAGRIDFSVTYNLGLDAGFDYRKATSLLPQALLYAEHPLAGRGKISLAELARYPLVLSNQGLSIRHMLDLFEHCGITPTIAHRAPSFETMRSLIANGLGVGLSYTRPGMAVSYDGLPIVEVSVTDDLKPEPVVIASHKLNPPLPVAEKLISDIVVVIANAISPG
jgi:DNA-binding transcriptional LysR family regulator